MRLGIFAKTYERASVEAVFQAVQGQGFGCVQFNMSCTGLPSLPEEIEPALAARVRAAAAAQGIEIAAVSGTYNMIHPDLAVRAAGLRRLGVLARACQGLGTKVITLCTGTRDPQDMWKWHADNARPEAWADLLAALEAALRIAEETDVSLAIEPEHSNVVSSAQAGRRLLDELRSPRLRVVLDGANLIEPGQPQRPVLDEAVDLLGPELVMVHAKDRTADGGYCAAGLGVMDYPHYLGGLRRAGFSGPLVMHGLKESEAPASAAFLTRLLDGD